jgi:hypothetical protein
MPLPQLAASRLIEQDPASRVGVMEDVSLKGKTEDVTRLPQSPAVILITVFFHTCFVEESDFVDRTALQCHTKKRQRALDQDSCAMEVIAQDPIALVEVVGKKERNLGDNLASDPIDTLPVARVGIQRSHGSNAWMGVQKGKQVPQPSFGNLHVVA